MINLFQAGAGDFVDASTTRNLVKKSPVLPAGVLKEHPSLTFCEDQVRIIAFICHLYLVKSILENIIFWSKISFSNTVGYPKS